MKILGTKAFLEMVWPKELMRQETLELRAIQRDQSKIRRQFLRNIDSFIEAANTYGPGWDIYFGVATRYERGGTKKDCYRTRCVWVDFDSTTLPALEDVPPDLVVNSGKGHHIYWILKEPVYLRDKRWVQIEAVNRALSKKFGADITTVDISRILRVPGYNNYKYNPARPVQAHVHD